MVMVKWEFLRLWYLDARISDGLISLTPHRDANAAILKAAGFEATTINAPDGETFATTVRLKSLPERSFWNLVDSMTADGWEPLKFHLVDRTYEMHFRRQVG